VRYHVLCLLQGLPEGFSLLGALLWAVFGALVALNSSGKVLKGTLYSINPFSIKRSLFKCSEEVSSGLHV